MHPLHISQEELEVFHELTLIPISDSIFFLAKQKVHAIIADTKMHPRTISIAVGPVL